MILIKMYCPISVRYEGFDSWFELLRLKSIVDLGIVCLLISVYVL